MDTYPVRLKWKGNPVAIVFRVDKDYLKGPAFVGGTRLEKDEKADRLLVLGRRWVDLHHQQRHLVT